MVVIFCIFCSNKSNNPNKTILKNQFAQILPDSYYLKSFIVENQQNIGTELKPIYKSKFKATVVLKENNLNKRRNHRIAPLPEKLRSKTIEGIAVLRLNGDVWEAKFERKNSDSNNIFITENEEDKNSFMNILLEDCDSEQCEIVNKFEEFYNEHNLEKLLSLLSDSLLIDGSVDKNGFKEEAESEFAFNNKIIITHKHQQGDTVFCDFELYSDFNTLLGIDIIHYDGSHFLFQNNMIIEIKLVQRQEDMRLLRRSFKTFVAWAEKNQNDKLSKLKQNGNYVFNKELVENWLSLLKLWNRNKS